MRTYLIFYSFMLLSVVSSAPTAEAATQTTPATTQAAVEARVREFFKDTPVMIEIARCESNFRQFTDAGNVLRGGNSGGMIGVFQFFESIHSEPAKALGFDLATLEGNLGYARHLYEDQHTTPWNAARSCWDTQTQPTRAQLEAQIKQLLTKISMLQKQLERKQKRNR